MARQHHTDDRTHIGEHEKTHGYTGGKAPLPKGGSVLVHDGMSHVGRDGVTYTGITPTEVAKARAGAVNLEANPMSPEATARRFSPAPIHPSQDPAHIELGRKLLAGVKPAQFMTLSEQRRKAKQK
jgi:hypothetical protein